MELTREQINRIVELVLRQLASHAGPDVPHPPQKVVAVFCGGMPGAAEAQRAVRALTEQGCSVTALFTPGAEQTGGAARLQEGAPRVRTPGGLYGTDLKALVDGADLVTVPIMTRASAGKLAHGIADNPALNAVMYALLQGRPVLAALDACAPERDTPMAALVVRKNLQLLEACGVRFVPAAGLLGEADALLRAGGPELLRTSQAVRQFTGRVLTVSHLSAYQGGVLSIPPSTIITPAARDEAQKRGIEFRAGTR